MKAPDWGRMDYRAWFDSTDVQLMTWKERAIYGDLLKFQWRHGWIPADPRAAARMVGVLGDDELAEFADLFAGVIHKFEKVDEKRLANRRQAEERKRAIKAWKQKKKAGRRSAKSRASTGDRTGAATDVRTTVGTTDPTTDAIDVDLDVDLDTETEEETSTDRSPDRKAGRLKEKVDAIVAIVSENRTRVGMPALKGGSKVGRGYIRSRIKEYDIATVERVARYAAHDPWISETPERMNLQPIFSPKSFPLLLDRAASVKNGNGLSASDRRVLAHRQRLEEIEL